MFRLSPLEVTQRCEVSGSQTKLLRKIVTILTKSDPGEQGDDAVPQKTQAAVQQWMDNFVGAAES